MHTGACKRLISRYKWIKYTYIFCLVKEKFGQSKVRKYQKYTHSHIMSWDTYNEMMSKITAKMKIKMMTQLIAKTAMIIT